MPMYFSHSTELTLKHKYIYQLCACVNICAVLHIFMYVKHIYMRMRTYSYEHVYPRTRVHVCVCVCVCVQVMSSQRLLPHQLGAKKVKVESWVTSQRMITSST